MAFWKDFSGKQKAGTFLANPLTLPGRFMAQQKQLFVPSTLAPIRVLHFGRRGQKIGSVLSIYQATPWVASWPRHGAHQRVYFEGSQRVFQDPEASGFMFAEGTPQKPSALIRDPKEDQVADCHLHARLASADF